MLLIILSRFAAVILIGVILFVLLLHIAGWKEGIKLKRSKKSKYSESNHMKLAIVLLYVWTLISLFTFGFVIIRISIRGAL